MATRPDTKSSHSSCAKHRARQILPASQTTALIRTEKFPRLETGLSANDELQCRQIYGKLQQLQPNGVCVNLNTLRRALYPPLAISSNRNEQILLLKTYHHRPHEMPRIRTYEVPKATKIQPINCMTIDQIINQVKKHAEINYSYYTRTK